MKILSLGFCSAPDEIRARLHQDCRALLQEGFRVAVDESSKGGYTFLGCNIAEGELSFRNYERVKNKLKNYVAHMLAEYIVTKEEKTLIRKIITRNYYYFGEQERTAIYENTIKLLNGESCHDFGYITRLNRILAKLKEYFEIHHEMVLNGFIAFRLKDYCDRLAEVVDKAVEEYMMDMEYKEFVRVLRYFVDIQESQVEEVHIVLGDGDAFKIRDSLGRNIHNQYLETVMLRNDEINYEDLLISALITIAPQTVILHLASAAGKASTVVETIKSVFAGRVDVCRGCKLCNREASAPETERN